MGLGIAQNTVVTDFSFRISFIETDMGILRNHYHVSYSLVYDFNQDHTFYLNHFINFGYRRNFSNKRYKYKWFGAEVGYLIHSESSFFKSPTFKLGVVLDITKNIHLTPEVFFDDGFKKVYPGIRLGIDIFGW